MDQPRWGHPTTQRITLVRTPSPPRNYSDFEDELKIHQLVGIPEVNLSDYCKQRFQLIEGYKSNIKELQKFYNEQIIEEYWKFKFQHLKLVRNMTLTPKSISGRKPAENRQQWNCLPKLKFKKKTHCK